MEQKHGHICPPEKIRYFDNFLRSLVHPPQKIFGPLVKPGMHILDVGCGGGFTSLALAKLAGPGGRVVAADVQQKMLDMVAARAKRAGISQGLEFHLCASDRIGAPGSFHFVNAMMMVHEIPDQAAFFEEVRGLLHPGARVLVAEPRGHVTGPAFAKTLALAAAAGLRQVAKPRVLFCRAAVFESN